MLRTENEIINNWKGDKKKPLVSICCTAYNHESYIEDAIKGFLIQETDFPFEILIHDDASTDNTANIIREYEKLYPNIIKVIYQTENQYSQGKRIIPIAARYCSGEFVALCEGDDFWIDNKKIQKQIETLEQYKGVNICITKAISLFPNGMTEFFCDLGDAKYVIPFDDCIIGPEKDFFPTASFFIRKSVFNDLPGWYFTDAPVGDYYLQLWASKEKGCVYLPEATTVYRRDALGSWMSNKTVERCFLESKQRIKTSLILRKYLNRKYHKSLSVRFGKRYLPLYIRNLSGAKTSDFKDALIFKAIFNYPLSLIWFVVFLIKRL